MPRKQEESARKRKESAMPKSAGPSKRKQTAAKSAITGGKRARAGAAVKKSAAKPAAAKVLAAKLPAKKSAAPKKKTAEKKSDNAASSKISAAPKKSARSRKALEKTEDLNAAASAAGLSGPVEDPIGEMADGEAHFSLAPEAEAESGAAIADAYRAEASEEASHDGGDAADAGSEDRENHGETAADRSAQKPEPQLQRLQKILSQAGVASRRHAEEMIVAGRVMVNGQVVTQLGAKADPAQDHIRVDGKMIQGAERHRTFLLNKPKGYVTTVSDPEGRPTVMNFFEKMHERLYPVGRLDYQSEGLLLMTNDGELANGLTRAAAGVEKIYLVKVAGQPTEDELEQLRSGVSIDREQAGSGRVRTAPASVRHVRAGDNPWYEVVLTEGRNRELRKMFQAIGHFVEKIRRVGYGPLVLDVEPGQFRELTAEEVTALRLTAEGKLKPRRPKLTAMLTQDGGRAAKDRTGARFDQRRERPGEARGEFRRGAPSQRPFRAGEERGRRAGDGQARGKNTARGSATGAGRPKFDSRSSEKPRFDRPSTDRPRTDRSRFDQSAFGPPRGEGQRNEGPRYGRPKHRSEGGRERFDRTQGERPRFDRSGPPRSDRRGQDGSNRGERTRFRGEQQGRGGPGQRNLRGGQPGFGKPGFDKPRFEPRFDRTRSERPERGRGPESSHQESRPRRDFPHEGRPHRGGEQPVRFGAPRFDRERGERQSRGEWKPRESSDRQQRPPRREGPSSFGGAGRAAGGNPRGGPRFGAKPGSSRGTGFRPRRGGGPARPSRGPQRG